MADNEHYDDDDSTHTQTKEQGKKKGPVCFASLTYHRPEIGRGASVSRPLTILIYFFEKYEMEKTAQRCLRTTLRAIVHMSSDHIDGSQPSWGMLIDSPDLTLVNRGLNVFNNARQDYRSGFHQSRSL
jgi:hypothetical protein